MTFFYGQYRGGDIFFEENEENVYYYRVPEDSVKFEILNNKFKDEYDLGKSMGDYKYYKDADEFISENIKEFFKFCPKKLKEYEDYRKNNKPTKRSDDNDDKDSDKAVKEAQEKYDKAKEKEQSLANRMLGGVTMAATGIGGMELAQGLSEQRIDRESEQDMMAYMETFRCEYGGGKSVKNGATNVELPADTLFVLYQEYITLAADLKERKEQLGLAPGIESEVIIDKATAGLYDDKASEKANGTYASIYRAKMGNETDQAKLQEMSDTSGKRVKGGAIAAGAGALVGIVGNSLINGKLGDKIKEAKEKKDSETYKIKSDKNPTKCALSECLNQLTISNRTKNSELYTKVSNFCTQQFPQETDCDKIMLVYSTDSSNIKSIDFLIANNYAYDFYKEPIINYCDWHVCIDKNDPSLETELFSERWYDEMRPWDDMPKMEKWAKTCFKTAGAMDYLDLGVSFGLAESLKIDYEQIDCSKLDEGKSNTDIIIKGNNISEYFEFAYENTLSNWRKLLGSYAKYVNKRAGSIY